MLRELLHPLLQLRKHNVYELNSFQRLKQCSCQQAAYLQYLRTLRSSPKLSMYSISRVLKSARVKKLRLRKLNAIENILLKVTKYLYYTYNDSKRFHDTLEFNLKSHEIVLIRVLTWHRAHFLCINFGCKVYNLDKMIVWFEKNPLLYSLNV